MLGMTLVRPDQPGTSILRGLGQFDVARLQDYRILVECRVSGNLSRDTHA